MTGPPSKAIRLSGATVDLRDGAVVDLSGGGDLLGLSFGAGATGRINVLAPGEDAAFAILPSYDGATPAARQRPADVRCGGLAI